MALTISTGFVVDDAIVVIENITRYLEAGMTPSRRRCKGAREIGFTVLSMSTSLIAVFIPILLMGGIVGRLFREFAVTLERGHRRLAGGLADHHAHDVRALPEGRTTPEATARLYRISERGFDWMLHGYEAALRWVLRHQPLILARHHRHGLLQRVICTSSFPRASSRSRTPAACMAIIMGAQDISFQAMQRQDRTSTSTSSSRIPAVDNVARLRRRRRALNQRPHVRSR